MACCSPSKTAQVESKRAETVKAFAMRRTPFQFALVLDTQGGSPMIYGMFVTTCGAGLLTSSCALTF